MPNFAIICGCLEQVTCIRSDCLPYRLLICKLRAYGLSVNACELLKSYFCERKQRVKLGDKYSHWLVLSKGVPQGSLMGPFILTYFLMIYYCCRY